MLYKIPKYIFLIILLFSCKNVNNKSNEDQEYNNDIIEIEYDYSEFYLYKVDSMFQPILNNLIQDTKECNKNSNNDLIYTINMYRDKNSTIKISIELRELNRIYCNEIKGLLKYNNEMFILKNDIIENKLFIKSNIKSKIRCQKENILNYDHREDKEGFWHFIVKNRKIICIGYGYCGENWVDEKYYND